MDYRLYHDESKEYGYWHGILLVPESSRDFLLSSIKKIRKIYDYEFKLHFVKTKRHGRPFNTIKNLSELANVALIHDAKGRKIYYRIGNSFEILECPLKCKYILFRITDNFISMYKSLSFAEKVEITCKIAIKGGCHYLSNASRDSINIKSIHFDNYEHLRRRYNPNYLLKKLKNEFSDNCCIDSKCKIDDRDSNHKKTESQPWDDCQFLQITDIILGGLIFESCSKSHEFRSILSKPFCDLLIDWNDHFLINSRWKGGFVASEGLIINDSWQFKSDITYHSITKSNQIELDL